MRIVTCDLCGQQLPDDNQLSLAIMSIGLDLCPKCQSWASGLGRDRQIHLMLEGFRRAMPSDLSKPTIKTPVARSVPTEAAVHKPEPPQDGRTDGRTD